MKNLTDEDIEKMAAGDFCPDDASTRATVRKSLRLSTLIPPAPAQPPKIQRIDLHKKTEQQAWDEIMDLAQSGVRNAIIITGASGILKIKFQQWANESILSPYIASVTPINNGSFAVKFKKHSN